MRVEVDQKKLEEKMQKKGIKNLKQLAELCGIPYEQLKKAYQRQTFSKECLWLISTELECAINDIVTVNWKDT